MQLRLPAIQLLTINAEILRLAANRCCSSTQVTSSMLATPANAANELVQNE